MTEEWLFREQSSLEPSLRTRHPGPSCARVETALVWAISSGNALRSPAPLQGHLWWPSTPFAVYYFCFSCNLVARQVAGSRQVGETSHSALTTLACFWLPPRWHHFPFGVCFRSSRRTRASSLDMRRLPTPKDSCVRASVARCWVLRRDRS